MYPADLPFDSHPEPCQNLASYAAKGREPSGLNDLEGDLQKLRTGVKKKRGGSPHRATVTGLTDLPYEIVHHIADHLDVRSIGALSQVCHSLNDAVRGLAIDRLASHYYGPPGSASRHLYESLYNPLTCRLFAATKTDPQAQQGAQLCTTVPLSGQSQERRRLCQAVQLRTLANSGQLTSTCSRLPELDCIEILATGISTSAGTCALLGRHTAYDSELYLLSVRPKISIKAVAPVKGLRSYMACAAHILADNRIVIAGIGQKTSPYLYLLTLYTDDSRHGRHEVLPGAHRSTIFKSEVLPCGRLASVSSDGTLKVRPLDPNKGEADVITLAGHTDGVTDLLAFEDGRIVSSSWDGTLKVWRLNRPKGEECIATLIHMARSIFKLSRLDQERFIATIAPNVLLVWQMNHTGADCIALLDRNWSDVLPTPYTVTPEGQYELPAVSLHERLGKIAFCVLPGGYIFEYSADKQLSRCYHLNQTQHHTFCTLNLKGQQRITLPVWTAGPNLAIPFSGLSDLALLPDGRLVCTDERGSIIAIDLQESTTTLRCSTLFSSLQDERTGVSHTAIGVKVFADGLLLITASTGRLFLCDPYETVRHKTEPLSLTFEDKA